MVNLALEKSVTMEGKGRGELRSEIEEVTGMTADTPTISSTPPFFPFLTLVALT